MPTKRTYYYNAKGKKVRINPARSTLMKQVMRHRKGKKLSTAVKRAISKSVKHAHATGMTKSGRRVIRRVSR